MWVDSLRELFRNRLVCAGTSIIALCALLALTAPWLTRAGILSDPNQQDERGLDEIGMPLSPNHRNLLGSDPLGRDVMSRVVHGTRVSLAVGVAAMLTATLIGLSVGLAAGFFGGKVDLLLMRLTEMSMTVPAILLAIAFAGLVDVRGRIVHLHPSQLPWHFLDFTLKRGMVTLFLVIGFVCWPGMVRVIRAQVLTLKERDFVQASRSLGASNWRLIFHCILPNLLSTVIILSVMNTANTILLEAGLGYLGISVPPPAPAWGSMIAEGQAYFVAAPHIVLAPGIAIVVTVLGFNLLGQGLREVLEPKK